MNFLKVSSVVLLVMWLLLMTTVHAGPPVFPVTVENTPAVTVNGTADVNVVNTPTVNAEQSGSWEVGIVGAPGVTIENGPNDPVPVYVNTVPREPAQCVTNGTLGGYTSSWNNSLCHNFCGTEHVFVIETIGVTVEVPSGQGVAQLYIEPDTNGVRGRFPIRLTKNSDRVTGTVVFGAFQQTKLYSYPYTGMNGRLERTSTVGSADWRFAFSGYCTPLDSISLVP